MRSDRLSLQALAATVKSQELSASFVAEIADRIEDANVGRDRQEGVIK